MRASSKRGIALLGLVVILAAGCGGDDGTTPPPAPAPALSLVASDDTLDVGQAGALTVTVQDVDDGVFALSLRIGFDPGVVAVDEGTPFAVGDYPGPDALALCEVADGVIHLAVTEVAGGGKALAGGTLGTIAIRGLAAGACAFTLDPAEVRFLDAEGEAVVVEGLALDGVTLTVR